MKMTCLLCLKALTFIYAPHLCSSCGSLLEPAQDTQDFHSLYRYNDVMRNLILKVKINGNYRALDCLTFLFMQSLKSQGLVQNCASVTPAPSSLWSRMNGKTDLAWFLALSLAKYFSLKFVPAPLGLRWEMNKRSKMKFRNKDQTCDFEHLILRKEMTVLIVDDVVTSGHTLRRTAAAIKGVEHRFLTLASAFR